MKNVMTDIVARAEKLDLGANDYAIFQVHALDLTVVIQFEAREIHVMTHAEAVGAGLPLGTEWQNN